MIARDWGALVFPRPNIFNLNVNTNFTFDQATGDFILCLDADEVVPEETAGEIRETISQRPQPAAFYLPRRNYFFGRWLKHGGHYPDWQLRLFRRGKARFPEKHIHERLQVDGKIDRLRNPFNHYPYETKEECQRKLDRDTNFEAKYLYENGIHPTPLNALKYLYLKPGQRFLRRYVLKLGFLDGPSGWEAARMDMQNFRWRYNKLRKLAKEKSK